MEVNGRTNEHEGYVPQEFGVGGGDYIEFSFCLECGQIQRGVGGFPLPLVELETRPVGEGILIKYSHNRNVNVYKILDINTDEDIDVHVGDCVNVSNEFEDDYGWISPELIRVPQKNNIRR